MAELRWRPWLRALHRDVGYLAVGLTIVYAVSGLAVNHIADWDPNFTSYERQVTIRLPNATDNDQVIAQSILAQLGVNASAPDVYRASPTQLEISLDKRQLHVDLSNGRVIDEGQQPRFFLRVANWLHLNRGKRGWRWFADSYAVFLLFLATSGLFMLPGKKGLRGRGALLAGAGILTPLLYLRLVGGPDHARASAPAALPAQSQLEPTPTQPAPLATRARLPLPPRAISSARSGRRRAPRR